MTEIDSKNLHVCCTAKKLSKIKDFLAFAFAKKQSKEAKVIRNELIFRNFRQVCSICKGIKKMKAILIYFLILIGT